MRLRASLAALSGAALLTVSVAGCGGSGSGPTESPAKALAAAKTTMDQASSWHMVLSTDATPDGGSAVLKADGVGTHDPAAWKGTVDVLLKGIRASVPIVAVDGKVYAKLPFTLGYAAIDPTEYDAPDPAGFMDPSTGLSSLLTKLSGARSTGTARAGSQVVTTYGGDLDGADVKRIIPSADASATYATTVNVNKSHQVTSVTVKGPFFSGSGDVTYTLNVDDYDQDVKISAP